MTGSNFSVARLEPELKQLYFIWRDAALGAAMPRLKNIGLPCPQTQPGILSNYEVLRSRTGEPIDFNGLYVRSKLKKTLSKVFTGTKLSDHPGKGPGSKMWGAFVLAATDPLPLHIALLYSGPLTSFRSKAQLYLTVAGYWVTIEFVMVGVSLNSCDSSRVFGFPFPCSTEPHQ